MKKLLFLLLLAASQVANAQSSTNGSTSGLKPPQLDKSPMDMAYYPVNYPVLKIQDKASEPLLARVIYSRPQKEGRTIFGGLVEYGKVWRLGANEATEIEVYKDVKVKDRKLAKGRYSLFAIPTETEWTLIFNKDTDVWGAFKYDEKKDVLRVTVPVQKNTTPVEPFTIFFVKNGSGADLVLAWDDATATVPVSFK